MAKLIRVCFSLSFLWLLLILFAHLPTSESTLPTQAPALVPKSPYTHPTQGSKSPHTPPTQSPAQDPKTPHTPPTQAPAQDPKTPHTPPTQAPAPDPKSPPSRHTPVSPASPPSRPSSSGGGLKAGQKAGIAIGVICGAGIVGLGGFAYKKRRENTRRYEYGFAARRRQL